MRAILMIVIDCLRADHVSCYGYPRETTPTLDSFAQNGVLWEQAHSTSSWTKPSVTSLFTGLYPSQHGAFVGIKRSKNRSIVTTDILHSATPTLAENLTRAGWRCGAFINNAQLDRFTRLDRGFQEYQPRMGKADHLIEAFGQWFAQDTKTPTYAYLHFLEAHWPYRPRRRHVKMFGGDRDTNIHWGKRARDYARLGKSIAHDGYEMPEEELKQLIQLYDGAVRRLDGKINNICKLLKDWGIFEDTAIFVTADHGEEFLDHGRLGHGQGLHRELTHVPLLARLPGHQQPQRISQTISHVDVPYTLASLAGATDGLPGSDLLNPHLTSSPAFSELRIRHRYSQTYRTDDWTLMRRFRIKPGDEDLPSTQTPREWLANNPHETSEFLYNRKLDPAEQNNVWDDPAHQKSREALVSQLDTWWETLKRNDESDADADEVELDPRVVQHLRDLGYLE